MSRFATSAATVPEPCAVLGTSLRPFCLGHHLIFKRLGLPFCGNSLTDASDDDLLIGIAICGQSYEDGLNQILSGEWNSIFSAWSKRVRKRISPAGIKEGFQLFRAYLQDGYAKTPVWQYVTSKGVVLSGPWEVTIKNALVMGGYSESEVLNGYLPGRWYDYYSQAELNAAQHCNDPAKWRSVFYTEADAIAMKGGRR
jgi:hypothetical protein